MHNNGAESELSFSIANILKVERPANGCFKPEQTASGAQDSETPKKGDHLKNSVYNSLPWLAYTRYCPPKIPRSRNRKMVNRRRISGTPRVPFSTEQLTKLEKSYEETQYVSSAQVTQLSAMLKLPAHRIKIWFQNRRAREKKRAKKMTECIAPSKTIDKVVANDKPHDCVPYPAHVNSFGQCSGRKDKFSTHFAFHHFNRANMNNKEWCARLTLPPIHLFNHFDYNIYSGLTIHV